MILGRIIITLLVIGLTFSIGLAQVEFSEVAKEQGIDHTYLGVNVMGAGAVFFDMDNDGDPDLWLSGGLNRDALYENDGTGHFENISATAGLIDTESYVTTGAITGDMDNDGFKDVLIITHGGFPNQLLKNNGDKTFTNVTYQTVLQDYAEYSLAATLGDVNNDGYLDIYQAGYISKDELRYDVNGDVIGFNHLGYENKLFINNGDWTFTEAMDDIGNPGCALATMMSDYDNDDDMDIIVANDFGAWVTPNCLLENNASGESFEDVSDVSNMNAAIYGMGIAAGDYDNDLDLDYYITNLGENVLHQNNGDKTFSSVSIEAGVDDTNVTDSTLTVGWGTGFIDFDNDMDLDLFVVNGFVPAAAFIKNDVDNPNRLFLNQGDGSFVKSENQTIASPYRGRGFTSADIDGDGDMDFLVGNVNRQATAFADHPIELFRNDTDNGHNWLQIKLEGTTVNRDAFGSKVYITVSGQKFLQEANGGFGTHASQHMTDLHFGLGNHDLVESVEVRWIGGATETYTNIVANQKITIKEGGQLTAIQGIEESSFSSLLCHPNPFGSQIKIKFNLETSEKGELRIYDPLGRQVFSEFVYGHGDIDWTTLQNGQYQVQLISRNNTICESIVYLK